MRELLLEFEKAKQRRLPLAWCRLVETRGSTPQKAGAAMIVFANGAQAGTLGGGCVEAEVKRRALAALASGKSEIAPFLLDSDYGWDDGLICGGRMLVAIEPVFVAPEDTGAYFSRLALASLRNEAVTEAILVAPHEPNQTAPTQMMLVDEQQRVVASRPFIDGENSNARVLPPQSLRPLATRPRPYVANGYAFLPLLPRCSLMIVGGGHVGLAVAELAAPLEFRVTVVDDRPEFANPERFPQAERCLVGPLAQVLPDLEINNNSYCLIVTRGHNHDQEALFHLAERGARYLGLIGSRRKIRLIFENLLAAGISRSALANVFAPVGLNIGSQTVPEIAVSICAELVAHRSAGERPLRPSGETLVNEIAPDRAAHAPMSLPAES